MATTDLETLVAALKAQIRECSQLGKELLEETPDLATPLRALVALPADKIDESVDKLVATLPEEEPVRQAGLELLLASLEATKKRAEETQWRIKRRIQPEGKPRQEHQFRSFCKRKPEW